MKKILLPLLFFTLLMLPIGSSYAVNYQVYQLSPLSSHDFGAAFDINASGDVICGSMGWSYIWNSSSGFAKIGENQAFIAYAINDDGLVAGATGDIPVVRAKDGHLINLELGVDDPLGIAWDINNSGLVAGYINNRSTVALWSAEGKIIQTWDGPFGGVGPVVINDSGDIAWGTSEHIEHQYGHYNDQRAYRWTSDHGVTELPSLPDADIQSQDFVVHNNKAYSINDSGQIVGTSGDHAVVWNPDGSMIDLGKPDAGYAWAYDINNNGQIVGVINNEAVLWDLAGNCTMLDLLPGSMSTCAYAINDAGQIVGYSTAPPENELPYATIWQPVPEPTSIATLLVGLLPVGTMVLRLKRS